MAVVAEWLRRLTRNQIPSGSVGSSPTDCVPFFLILVGSKTFCHKIVRCVQEFDFSRSVLVLSLLFADLRVLKMSTEPYLQKYCRLSCLDIFDLFATEVFITVFT